MSDGLDPAEWTAVRDALHRAVDELVDDLAAIREGPAWRPVPDAVKAEIAGPLPRRGASLDGLLDDYRRLVAPYGAGNTHPAFFGWAQGGGNAAGILADLLAAGLNPNVGGRDHAAVYVERAVVGWFVELFGFPPGAGGILTTGTSAANLLAAIVAREATPAGAGALAAYTSSAAHDSVAKALRAIGLAPNLRVVPVDGRHALDPAALAAAVAADRAAGARPFLVVATAGTVDLGAFDPLEALADLCARERIWLHVDGAFGALARLSPAHARLTAGIERADSLAFDAHKWLQVPYDAGCLLVRDAARQRAAFSSRPAYLQRGTRGIAGGDPWYADYGLELSRGFRALKLWFTLRHYGVDRLGEVVAGCCARAARLGALVEAAPDLELLAPVLLNVVAFRYRFPGAGDAEADALTEELALRIQEGGEAVLSTTRVGGRSALRACVLNHRTQDADVERLAARVRETGATLSAERGLDSAERSARS